MSTPNEQELQQVFDAATPQQLLRFAKLVRAAYVESITSTRTKLDPARLRALDGNIKRLESQLN